MALSSNYTCIFQTKKQTPQYFRQQLTLFKANALTLKLKFSALYILGVLSMYHYFISITLTSEQYCAGSWITVTTEVFLDDLPLLS